MQLNHFDNTLVIHVDTSIKGGGGAAYLMVFTSIIPPSSYFIFLLFYKKPLYARKSEEQVGNAEVRKTEIDAGT